MSAFGLGSLFEQPAPQQAVPGDLQDLRAQILQAILGITGGGGMQSGTGSALSNVVNRQQQRQGAWRPGHGGFSGAVSQPGGQGGTGPSSGGMGGQYNPNSLPGNSASAAGGMSSGGANQYLGSQGQTQSGGQSGGVLGALLGLINQPGGDTLGALRTQYDTNLNDQIQGLNASSPGRFSSANLFAQGQLRERSLEDFNAQGANILAADRNRQLQAIMALLGPVLGTTFGGPFTQGQSPFGQIAGLGGSALPFLFPGGGAPKAG